jgi:hypothetical protein
LIDERGFHGAYIKSVPPICPARRHHVHNQVTL